VATEGEAVHAGDPIFEVHYRDRAKLANAVQMLSRAMAIGATPPAPRRLIVGEVR
jgi:thymidine phosphorylase